MDIKQRMSLSESKVLKAVFPDNTNHYDSMFGGKVLSMMDEIAFIAATRFSRKKMVTVNSKEVNFFKSIPAGTILELIAKVVEVGNSSVQVEVKGFVEQMYQDGTDLAVHGFFTLVSINDDRKSTPILV